MAESDAKGELGGLAQSIDALFSQTPPSTDDVSEPEQLAVAPPVEEPGFESEAEADPVAAEQPVEPDPFDSLEAHGAGTAQDMWEIPAEPSDDLYAEPDASLSADATPDPSEVFSEEIESELEAVEEQFAPEPAEYAVAGVEPGSGGDGLDEAVESFLSGAPSAAGEVREIAAGLRERLALDPLADAVERLIHSGDSSSNGEALALAREIMNPAVASRLVQRMGHEEDEEARAAYVVLSQRLGVVMANAFRGALTSATDAGVRRACHEGLIGMGETSRPVIEAMLEDDNRFLVLNAVVLLGDLGGDGALELVTSALANTDARVRCEALGSIAKLGGEDSGQLVMASMEDSDPKVRAAAAVAAGELRVERALRPILFLMEDEDDPSVVVPLLNALGSLGDPGAVQAIEKRAVATLFSKPPTEIRVAAYRALHEIGTPHAASLIEKASNDKDPVVRTTARALASAE